MLNRILWITGLLCVFVLSVPWSVPSSAGGAVEQVQVPVGAPAPLREMPKGHGFILGQVVEAGTGEPVPGAVVTLTHFGALPGGIPGGPLAALPVTSDELTPSAPRRVIADGRGRFFFRELDGGRYGLSATSLGHISGGYLKKKPNGTEHFIDLGPDDPRSGVNILMWKYGAVSGTVTDEAGEPAVGVAVTALRRVVSGGTRQLIPGGSGVTDDRGIYRIANLTPGSFIVGLVSESSTMPVALADAVTAAVTAGDAATLAELRGNGIAASIPSGLQLGDLILKPSGGAGYTMPPPGSDGTILTYARSFFERATTVDRATVISLAPGEEHGSADFQLRPTPTAKVAGRVVGPDGPAARVSVRLMPRDFDEFFLENGNAVATTVTSGNGEFTFLGVPFGDYMLRVSGGVSAGGAARGPSATVPLWASRPVTVSSATQDGIAVTLTPGLTMSGRIEFSGTKAKPDDRDLTRLVISATPVGPRPQTALVPGRVAQDGTFRTSSYPPGRYLLSASSSLPGWTLQSIVVAGRDASTDPIDLRDNLAGIVVTFTDKSSEITGTIADAQGNPTATAEIVVFPADSDSWRQGFFSPRRVQLVTGTKAGTYAIKGLPAGTYFVAALDESETDDWQDQTFLARVERLATRITIKDGETVTRALTVVAVKSGSGR